MTRKPIIMLALHTGSPNDVFGRCRQWAADDGHEWFERVCGEIDAEYGDSIILGLNQPAGKLPGHKVTVEQWRHLSSNRRYSIERVCRHRLWKNKQTLVYVGGRLSMDRSMETNGPMELIRSNQIHAFAGFMNCGCTHVAFDLVSNRSSVDPPWRTADEVRNEFVKLAHELKEAYGTTCIGEAIPNDGDGRQLTDWTIQVPWMATMKHLDKRDPDRLWEARGKELYVAVRPGEDNGEREYDGDDLRNFLDRGFIPCVYTTSLDGFGRWKDVLDAYLHRGVV